MITSIILCYVGIPCCTKRRESLCGKIPFLHSMRYLEYQIVKETSAISQLLVLVIDVYKNGVYSCCVYYHNDVKIIMFQNITRWNCNNIEVNRRVYSILYFMIILSNGDEQ